jgi:hypothetical protein
MAAIHLDEHARAGHPFAALAMFGWPASARAAEAQGAQDAMHRGMGEDEILALGQQLSEMPVVDACVRRLREADHPGSGRRTHPPG